MSIPAINVTNSASVCEILQSATELLLAQKDRVGCTHHLPSTGKILVSGDLHDNPNNFARVIHLAELDNPENHVVLQELIHSGQTFIEIDLSYKMLIKVAALVEKYPNQVHPILANHELSQVTNRYITKRGIELLTRFIDGVDHVFGDESDEVLGALYSFVHAMPLAVRSSSGLFCSHSLPDVANMNRFDVSILDRDLELDDLKGTDGSAYMMVWGRKYTAEQVDNLAKLWDVKLFCLGHAWVPSGIELALDNVLIINSDHDRGAALPISLDNIPDAKEAIHAAVQLETVLIESTE